jgi:predicted ester cyclase
MSSGSAGELKSALELAIRGFNNIHDRSAYYNLYDANLITHGYPPDLPANLEGLKMFYKVLWSAFPDGRVDVDDVVVDGTNLACRYTFTGTQNGEFMGIAPTWKRSRIDGMTFLKFRGTKCIERWNLADMFSLTQQLGGSKQ